MKQKLIIGLSGVSESGKTTVASIIRKIAAQEQNLKYFEYSFADSLKNICSEIIGYTPDWSSEIFKNALLNEKFYVEELSRAPTGRELLTRVADALKRSINPNLFVQSVLSKIHYNEQSELSSNKNTIHVITDVRYLIEATNIKRMGGSIILIERPTLDLTKPKYLHSSETSLQQFKQLFLNSIINSGTLEELENLTKLALDNTLHFMGKQEMMPNLISTNNQFIDRNTLSCDIIDTDPLNHLRCYEWKISS